jgi:hypothetical protein
VTSPQEPQEQEQEPQDLDAEEQQVAAVVSGVLVAWLGAVSAAVLAGAGVSLLALFGATNVWRSGVEKIIATCAQLTGVTDPSYWDQVRRHLLVLPDETFQDLQNLISSSVRRGDSLQATKQAVREWLDYNTSPHNWPFQAQRTAVTETNAAYNISAQREAVAAGYTTKTWEDRHDTRVRAGHVATRGQTVGISQFYLVDGQWPAMQPGDPRLPAAQRINCRCRSKFGRRKR